MTGPIISYPPEIGAAMDRIRTTAATLQQEMDILARQVAEVTAQSKGAVVTSFGEVQRMWNQTGLAHTETMNATAKAGTTAHNDMIGLDSYLANRLA